MDWHRPAARIALASLAFYVVLLVVPIRLDRAGWSGAAAGLLVGLFALGAALGALATDPLRRWLGPRHTLQLLVGAAAGAVLTITVAPATGIALGPLLLLAGTALGAILTGGFTSGLDRTSTDRAGTASGRLSLARYIGSIVGTASLPPLLATTGVTGALVVAVAGLLAVPMTLRATPAGS